MDQQMQMDLCNGNGAINLIKHHITFVAKGMVHTGSPADQGLVNGFTNELGQCLQGGFAGWSKGNQIHTIPENIWLVQLANLLGKDLLQKVSFKVLLVLQCLCQLPNWLMLPFIGKAGNQSTKPFMSVTHMQLPVPLLD